MIPKFLSSLFGKKETLTSKVSITAVNLKFMGNTHSLKGMEVNSAVFDYAIPFHNIMGSSLLPDNLKGPGIKINDITVSEPFKLFDVDPKLPVEVPYLAKTNFIVKLKAPWFMYSGPVTINVGSDVSDNIALNVQKVVIKRNNQSVELENSEMMTTMQKSQLFKRDIQLYKVISFNEDVNKVEINAPFELVSVNPQLPIKVDKKDSYVMSLYIKAPQSSYSGNIEIKIS